MSSRFAAADVTARWRRLLAVLRAPLLGIAGAVAVGGLLMVVAGHDPIAAYAALVDGAVGGHRLTNLMATLHRATPIVGLGLAAALAFRAGVLNLGGEGQLVCGGLGAAAAGLFLPLPPLLLLPAALLAGMSAGSLWAWLASFLEARLAVPILISTLLLNYPARYFASYLVTHPWRDVASGMAQSARLPEGCHLPVFGATRLHLGSVLILFLVPSTAWVLRHTRIGFELRMTGENSLFARYAGVDVGGLRGRVMLTSGALAGLVGAIEVLAVHHRFIAGALTQPLYAWTGLMAALLAGSSWFGVLAAGLFFAGLETGGFGMERRAAVPRELSQVLQALVILLVSVRYRLGFGGGGRKR